MQFMSFSKIIKRKSRLLLPFSWLYQAGVVLHNKTYDWGFKKSTSSNLPLICVGNLSVGGTGKTPMVEYLLRLITPHYKTATISRGYKRESRGVLIANDNTSVSDIGDEPMQFHKKFPQAKIVVGEKRVDVLDELMQKYPETEVVILDDAFQHKAIQAGLNILLTEYDNLFTDDYYLPAGQLRDLKENYKKADIIVVTKCPETITTEDKKNVLNRIKPLSNQAVYFTAIRYGAPYQIFTTASSSLNKIENALLVTGIANPKPLISYLKRHDISLKVNSFPDHHKFSQNDIDLLKEQFQTINNKNKIILTTEKDAMRLSLFDESLKDFPVFAIPVEHQFLFDEAQSFNNNILQFINNKRTHEKKN